MILVSGTELTVGGLTGLKADFGAWQPWLNSKTSGSKNRLVKQPDALVTLARAPTGDFFIVY